MKFNICNHWVERIYKNNAQHNKSEFGIAKIPNTNDQVDYNSSELGSKLRGFEIEVGLTGLRANVWYFNWKLIIVEIEIDFFGDQ